MKTCSKCGETKATAEFYKRKASSDGLSSACRICELARAKRDGPRRNERYKERYRGDPSFRATMLERGRSPKNVNAQITGLHMRRAKKAGAAVIERVDYAEVIRRGNGICGICREAVAAGEESLDHIKELSNGGDHTYENCQLAHRNCNAKKAASDMNKKVATKRSAQVL